MSEPSLTLYGDAFWISPYFFSCHVALREKGLPFQVELLSLHKAEQHQEPFRERSVTGKVPVLCHDGFFVGESQAILEYLEEVFPPPAYPALLPAGARERARARQVLSWLRSDLLGIREERPTTTMFYHRSASALSPAGRAAAERLVHVAGLLVPEGAGPLFGAWTIADSDLAFMLHRLILNGHEVPARLRLFAEREWLRPTVQEFVRRQRPPYVAY